MAFGGYVIVAKITEDGPKKHVFTRVIGPFDTRGKAYTYLNRMKRRHAKDYLYTPEQVNEKIKATTTKIYTPFSGEVN